MIRVMMLCDGCDWTDASADLLVVPEGADPGADVRAYPGYAASRKRHLREWLVEERGYRKPTDAEAVTVWAP